VLAAGGLAVGMSLHRTPAAHGKSQAGARLKPSVKRSATPTAAPTSTAPPRARAGEVIRATAWITHEVSTDAIVACDLQICDALKAGGFPAGNEVPIGANSQSLSNASIVVVTPALRLLFSTVPSLGQDVTPAVLASFGSGSAEITVQVAYPGGGAAYQTALSQSVNDRIDVGEQLLNSPDVLAAPAARSELAAGQVDPRLLLVLQTLSSQQPIDIVGFGDSGPGASPGAPFRAAELATTDSASSLGSGYVSWMGSVLLHPNTAYPAITDARLTNLADGTQVALIEYAAPSPLGQIGPS
jgi:hypothetical protein